MNHLLFMRRGQIGAATRLLALSSSSLLSGCAGCTDDARGGGYLCGKQGINSGSYQRSIDTARTNVEDEQDKNARMNAEFPDLQEDYADTNARLSQVEQDLAELEAETEALKQKAKVGAANNAANRKELARLEWEVEQVRQRASIVRTGPGSDPERAQELAKLQRRYDELQQQIKILTGDT